MILTVFDYHTYYLRNNFESICKELLMGIPLTYFQFDRGYYDGGRVVFSTRLDWLEHCLNREFYKISHFEKHPLTYYDTNILWEYTNESAAIVYSEARDFFNIDNGFSIIRKTEHYCDFFHFAQSTSNSNSQFYLTNISVLQNFSKNFVEAAKDLIEKAKVDKFFYPNEGFSSQNNLNTQHSINTTCIFNKLTPTELLCIRQLIAGHTETEIAAILQISVRTVNEHIKNIKAKTSCYSLFQLGRLVAKTDLKKVILSESDNICHEVP